ncbi:sodium:solute symporter [Brevibacterium sp. HMSC07C04]|uniref:sodium:solute symporter n=1 Tax=Brevibacterium sp. HMSC07C04 TaxID=1581130 RepID=UPI0008A1176E|nr:sodium:solute symporter [Brevibacterium sp. HMSC07C04]OFS26890.1 sodium:solute symporter [Brevibacterium sp. HMSC07C04]
METAVVAVYLACMLAFGVWGRIRAKNQEDFLVAGRRLGPLVFMGTMAAVVLGGASTVGGVGLGYVHGLSGMWLVVCIGLGIIILSLLFAPTIQRLEIYTVSQMLELRYGIGSRTVSGIIMTAYGLMISTTSTVAYGAIFHSLLGIDRVPAVLIGGAVVIVYSMLGGMWSITMTDFVQFLIQTVGIFIILLPIVLTDAGGFTAIRNAVGPEAFDPVAIGPNMIITYVLIYTIGLLIGQDIWQRVFTARSPGTARWGGFAAGVYCVLYGAAGALVGVGARVLVPGIEDSDQVFTAVTEHALSPLLAGLVLSAALSAVMSTSSGALLAASTVLRQDVVEPALAKRTSTSSGLGEALRGSLVRETGDEVRDSRIYLVSLGIVSIILACVMTSVVDALTIAYNILVAGLFIPIVGGLVWKRGTIVGVLAGMIAGTGTAVIFMIVNGLFANTPIYFGLGASLIAYVVGSLMSRPTPERIMTAWQQRIRRGTEDMPRA